MTRILLVTGLGFLLASPFLALAQSDPGAREDAEAERKKLLRAADQIDVLQTSLDANSAQDASLRATVEQQRIDLDAAKAEIAALKNDNAALHAALEKLDAARLAERKELLDQVAKIVADAGKHAAPPAPSKADAPAPAPDAAAPAADEKGFEYVVVKGDTLHGIATAYQGNGVKVTVDDIRKANNMAKTDVIRTGQKLFIPKK